VITRGSTYDNRANLAPAFLAQIIKKYEGTRLGRQELNAEILDDVPGALWNRALIEETRWPVHKAVPDLIRASLGGSGDPLISLYVPPLRYLLFHESPNAILGVEAAPFGQLIGREVIQTQRLGFGYLARVDPGDKIGFALCYPAERRCANPVKHGETPLSLCAERREGGA
jgi:hypothetical protein